MFYLKITTILIMMFLVDYVTSKTLLESLINNNNNRDLSKKELPHAIIIGAKKCGTRALLKFIGAHSDVATAGAEVHYFDRHFKMGINWYREQMPYSNKHQLTIEKTPKYFVDDKVPERIHSMNSSIKLIVVLRDPVTRAISEYTQSISKFNANKNLFIKHLNYSRKFEQLAFDKKTKKINTKWPTIKNGMYIEHVKKWLKYFPLEQILFVNGEQLITNPANELQKVEHFLGLQAQIKQDHFVYNYRKNFPCIVKPLDTHKVKCLSGQKGRKHPHIDEHILNSLKEFYRPYDKELFKTIGQKPFW